MYSKFNQRVLNGRECVDGVDFLIRFLLLERNDQFEDQ